MTRSNRALARALFLALGAAAVSGCSSTGGDPDVSMSGGQTGSESYGCLPVSVEPLEPEAVSEVGVSATDVLARFTAYAQGRLRYSASGEQVGYTLVLEQSEPARFEERAWTSDGSGIESAASCEDTLIVPVTVAFDTDDGAFSERWTSFVATGTADMSSLHARAALDELAGSYAPNPRDVINALRVDVLFDLTLIGPTFVGALSAQIEERSGEAVGAREIPIATFPAPAH